MPKHLRILRNPGDGNGGDAGNGGAATTTGEPTAPNGNGAGQNAEKTFTQDQVNQIAADRAKSARSKATSDLLLDLGVEDMDSLKTTLVDWKSHQDGQLSELEKAQAQLAALESVNEKAKSAEIALENANTALKANVNAQLKELKVPKHLTELIEAMEPITALEYLTTHAAALRPSTPIDTDASKSGGSGKVEIDEAAIRATYGI